MKISILLIFISAFNLLAKPGYSQSEKISLKLANVNTIGDVISEIERTTDYVFIYNEDVIPTLRNEVDVEVTNQSLDEILNLLLEGTDLAYNLSSKQVTLYKDESKKIYTQLTSATPLAVQQPSGKTITGRVIDTYEEPLPGVTVVVKGTTKGTTTDVDGSFSLTDVQENATLQFSFVGMKTQEIPLDDRTTITVVMEPEDIGLEEVVVIGYGTAKRRDIVGAVEQVSSDILESRTNMNVVRSLQGQVSGVEVSLWDGKPNRSSTPVIRGTTFNHGKSNTNSIGAGGEALVLIDGAEGDISYLNPNDIESISVLKDASSAAVYGARGAFGVILITTKNAKKGAPQITYDGKYSVLRRSAIPERVTNGYQWTQMYLQSWQLYNQRTTYPTMIDNVFRFSEDWFNEFANRDADPTLPKVRLNSQGRYEYFGNTDWYDLWYKDYTISNEHNITMSGGSDDANYYFSGRFYDHNGIYKPFDEFYKQYNVRGKGNIKLSSKLLLENNMNFAVQETNEPMVQYNDYLIPRMISRQGYPPTLPKNPDGTWTEAAVYIGYAAAVEGSSYQHVDNFDLKNTTALTYTPIKDKLTIKADFTYAATHRKRERAAGLYEFFNGPTISGKKQDYSYLKVWNWEEEYISSNVVGTYNSDFGENHHLTLMGGWNIEDKYYRSQYTYRRGLLYNTKPSFTLMDGDFYQTNDGGYTWGVVGFFSRINYKYKNRYFLELSTRYDGSSKFPLDQQWGVFPSASLGWIISDENFMDGTNHFIDNLKLRSSVGSLGNGAVSPYQFISSMSIGNTTYLVNGAKQTYTQAPSLVPGGLTWETATTYNIGVDLDMFKNRFNFTFDRYNRITDNMYTVGPTLPAVIGASSPKGNNATLETKGWELSIGWRDRLTVAGKPLSWSVRGTLWDSQSWIKKYYNTTGLLTTYYEGQRLGDIWGFRVAGLFKDREEIDNWANQSFFTIVNGSIGDNNNHLLPGDLKFYDLNNDGRINYGDRTLDNHGDWEIIGNQTPRYQYGLNLSGNWNNFGLSLFFQGVGKRHWYPGKESGLFWGQYGRSYESALQVHTEEYRYTQENQNLDAYWPLYRGYQANRTLGTMSQPNDRYLQNVAYLRLKNLTIDYTLPQSLVNRIFVKNAKLYFSGDNLLTFTPLYKVTKNFDPEGISSGDIDFQSSYGDDKAGDGYGYPIFKSYTIGLTLNF